MENQTMGLVAGWTDWTTTTGSAPEWTGDVVQGNVFNCHCNTWPCSCWRNRRYMNYVPYVTTWTAPHEPEVALDLDQIGHLQKLAKEDDTLCEILKKFTPYIEVVVDFE